MGLAVEELREAAKVSPGFPSRSSLKSSRLADAFRASYKSNSATIKVTEAAGGLRKEWHSSQSVFLSAILAKVWSPYLSETKALHFFQTQFLVFYLECEDRSRVS